MGFLDKIKKGIGEALYEEEETSVEAPHPATPIITPLVTNVTQMHQQVFQNTDNVFGSTTNGQTQPVVTEEDKKKYQAYFTSLYNEVKTKSADYGQFLINIETATETDPTLADASKFKMAFAFMKVKGVTKERLVASVNDAINLVDNDRNKFNQDVQEKNAAIEKNNKSISDKQLAIQKLTEEIHQLQNDNEATKERISIKTLLYNSLSQQLITKIKNDILGINNLI